MGVEKYMSGFAHENRSLPSHCSTDACARKIAEGVGTVRVDVRSLLRKLRLQQAEMAYLRTWAATAGAAYLPLQYDELRRGRTLEQLAAAMTTWMCYGSKR